MKMKKSPDVVVIGGGVIGTATAYFLSRKGARVILLERGSIAEGTSGRCDGNVLVQDKMPGFDCQLTKFSLELFPKLGEELDYDIEWRQRGSVAIVENETEMEVAKAHCRAMVDQGLPFRILNRREMLADEPKLAEDIAGGIEIGCDGSLNPMKLAYALTRGAKSCGAEVRTNTEVKTIALTKANEIEKVVTGREEIFTQVVVDAAGVWAPEIGHMVGLEIPIQPRQGQIIVSERTFPVAGRKLMEFGYMMAKFEKGGYRRQVTPEMEKYGIAFVFEPTEAQNFLIGSSRQFLGMDTACSIAVLRAMAQRAIRFFPCIKNAKVIRTYAGLRPYTPDHLPIISPTRVKGFFVAAGHEGDGIGLSLITGKLMSQMIFEEQTEISTEPLKMSRFERPGLH